MNKHNFVVQDVAERMIERNEPYYTEELMALIPDDLKQQEITDANIAGLMEKLGKIRLAKENEFAELLGLNGKMDNHRFEKINDALNAPPKTLTPEQEQKRKELKFLFYVITNILHM